MAIGIAMMLPLSLVAIYLLIIAFNDCIHSNYDMTPINLLVGRRNIIRDDIIYNTADYQSLSPGLKARNWDNSSVMRENLKDEKSTPLAEDLHCSAPSIVNSPSDQVGIHGIHQDCGAFQELLNVHQPGSYLINTTDHLASPIVIPLGSKVD